MTTATPPPAEIEFFARHDRQIREWAHLEKRMTVLLTDAVHAQDVERTLAIFSGRSGEADVDFYMRNRHVIARWEAIQPAASLALHDALIERAGGDRSVVSQNSRGWTTIAVSSPDLDALREEHHLWVELGWTRGHLLSHGRGHRFPRLALAPHPDKWDDQGRAHIRSHTDQRARELGLRSRDLWWLRWGGLDEMKDGEGLREYADRCWVTAKAAADHLAPVMKEAVQSLG